MALIEVYAYLTEAVIYRINRLPEVAYLAFLNMIGITRHPPVAAWVDLKFSRKSASATATPTGEAVPIPAGTKVSSGRGGQSAAVFVTTKSVTLAADQTEVIIRGHHCELIEAELLGLGSGQPGQRFASTKTPIVATSDPIDMLLGVEITHGEVVEGSVGREHNGVTFEIWQPVAQFANHAPNAKVYMVDKSSGTVSFAPALDLPPERMVSVPAAGRQIRLWYRTGGGLSGNIAAGALTSLLDPRAGLTVTNPAPARGGRDMETLDAALARGPHEFFSMRRAVTAQDYELLATASSGGVERAKAFTRVTVRQFAQPGEVEVVLVPHVPSAGRLAGRLPLQEVLDHQREEARLRTQAELETSCALGTNVVTSWASLKEVAVIGRVVVRPEEDPDAVRARINDRLHSIINPLPTELNPTGWRFGEPLRASKVYQILDEPGVRFVDDVKFVVAEAPDGAVRTVAADQYQTGTWYAGSGEVFFRSTNDGQGWEPVGRFTGEDVRKILPAVRATRPGMVARPGTLAMVTRKTGDPGSRVYLSTDQGESWRRIAELRAAITDLAWIDRDRAGALLVASDVGLFEVALLPDSVPRQLIVEKSDPDRAFYAVETAISEQGVWAVAAAAQAQFGVYLSVQGGRPGTFGNVGLTGVDTRILAVQLSGPATVLWVGTGEADPARPGNGCARTRLFESDVRWESMSAGWAGGTCWDVTFTGNTVLAATQSAGVLGLNVSASTPTWTTPDVNSGLPLRDRTRFEPVHAVAGDPTGALAMAGGARGLHRSRDKLRWQASASRETRDLVTIPETWLLCSGEHQIEVVGAYAQPGD